MSQKYDERTIATVMKMKEEGLTRRETANKLDLTYTQVRKLIERQCRKIKEEATGLVKAPKSIGRPKKDKESIEEENKRLKMENELLKDFLKELERG